VRSVNVRQLKSNPSVALREAKKDLVVVMNRDTPDAVLVGIEQLGIADLSHVRRALAVALFRGGDISVATAAKVAQVPLAEMLGQLSALGIPLYGGTPAEAAQEIDTGARWLNPGN
jgi:predicted HTH domain antitoxin